MKTNVTCVPIRENFYITANFSVYKLLKTLWLKGNALEDLYLQGRFPIHNSNAVKVFRIAQIGWKYKKITKSPLTLDVDNQKELIILRLKNNSYKCIDLEAGYICCLPYDTEFDAILLENLKELDFYQMPKILEIKKGSYYKEQYINKKLFKTEPEKWEKYKKLIYQSFDDLHLKKMNEKMDSYVYSDALVRDIESQLKHFAHLSNEVEKIKEMMDFVKKSITDQKIYINYSHGDAWVGNIIRNKKSISLIDWHDFGNRSIFFDHITSIYSVVKINTQNKQWNGTGSRSIDKELNQLSNIYSIPIEKIKVYHFLFMLELIISRLKYKDEIGDEALKIAFDWTEKFKQVLKGECQI